MSLLMLTLPDPWASLALRLEMGVDDASEATDASAPAVGGYADGESAGDAEAADSDPPDAVDATDVIDTGTVNDIEARPCTSSWPMTQISVGARTTFNLYKFPYQWTVAAVSLESELDEHTSSRWRHQGWN